MPVPGTQGYDLHHLELKLRHWFEERVPEWAPFREFRVSANPNGSGLSNETFIVTAQHRGGASKWALRCAPIDRDMALFTAYDIPRQFRIMKALHDHSAVPVTAPLWLEEGVDIIGTPFFAMDFVAGSVPSDNPPWQIGGFLVDGTDDDRACAWWSMVELIAQVGKVDWRGIGLGDLTKDENGGSITSSLRFYEQCFRSGRTESEPFPEAERALRWLHDHLPTPTHTTLSWGDSKPGNFIFDGYRPIALMDWEMAGIAEPELDLANFLMYQYSHENTFDPAHRRPRMSGFGNNRDTIRRFETLIGRPLINFDFYWVFAAFRYLALAQRFIDILARTGIMPREQAEAAKIVGGSMTEPMMQVVDGRGSPADLG